MNKLHPIDKDELLLLSRRMPFIPIEALIGFVMVKSGNTYEEVADVFSCSRQNAHQKIRDFEETIKAI